MAANKNDLFQYVGDPGTATTLSAPGYLIGATSINVGATANWPTATGVTFAIDEAEVVDGKEIRVDGTYNEYVGTVATGTSITNVEWVRGDGDRNYSAGALTRVYIAISATRENRLVEGILEHSNQDGSLITQAVRDALSLGTTSTSGWEVGALPNVSTVTPLGNGSYTLTMASDVSATISEGMRLRSTATSARQTTSFSLDGSNDYFNKTSPAGMTSTDDFSVSAWVYLTSYAIGGIASRYNGTSGWFLVVQADGTIDLRGYNGASSNFSKVTSYQSIPLNKWVHVATQLDMSAFTATTTTSYVMINGVNVPAVVSRGGTNPTSLVQAGNLEIGSINGGANPFPGKIAQVAIYSDKVTQATHLARMNSPLVGDETSLVSAYSGVDTNDLNTTNANNLTAQNGATHATGSPFGNNGKSSTLDYGLVMNVATADITVQVPEGCTMPSSISALDYSTQANPYGWVSDKGRWQVVALFKNLLQTSIGGTGGWWGWAQGPHLPIQAGAWTVGWQGTAQLTSTVSGLRHGAVTMYSPSYAPNTNGDYSHPLAVYIYDSGAVDCIRTAFREIHVITTGLSTWYFAGQIVSATGSEAFRVRGDLGVVEMYAKPAGL